MDRLHRWLEYRSIYGSSADVHIADGEGQMKNIPFKAGSQNFRLLTRLYYGPVSNVEIVHKMHIFNYTGRISDLRRAGFEIIASKIAGKQGVYSYQLVDK